LQPRVVDRFDECLKTVYSDFNVYKCQLQDLAFSGGIARSLVKLNINEIKFSQHLINADLDPDEKNNILGETFSPIYSFNGY
jgi:hypothetical protein